MLGVHFMSRRYGVTNQT